MWFPTRLPVEARLKPSAPIVKPHGCPRPAALVDFPAIREANPCHRLSAPGWHVADIAAAVTEPGTRGVQFTIYDGMGQDALGIWTAPGGGAKIAWFKDPDGNVLSQPPEAPSLRPAGNPV